VVLPSKARTTLGLRKGPGVPDREKKCGVFFEAGVDDEQSKNRRDRQADGRSVGKSEGRKKTNWQGGNE